MNAPRPAWTRPPGGRSARRILPFAMTALAPVLWSTGGLGFRLVDGEPWSMLFWRSLFMTLTLLVVNAATLRRRFFGEFRAAAIEGFSVGIFIALALILYVLSITRTTVADSLLVQAAGPLFIVVLGWVVLRERVRLITVLALISVAVGISLILLPSLQRGGFSGNVFGLLKALAFAGATVVIRRKRHVNFLPALAVGSLIATLVAAFGAGSLRVEPADLLILAYLGVFQTGIAFMLHATFSGHLPSATTGLLVLLEAVLGPMWVWWFLGEAPSPLTLLGGVIILGTLVIHTLLYYRDAAPTGAAAAR